METNQHRRLITNNPQKYQVMKNLANQKLRKQFRVFWTWWKKKKTQKISVCFNRTSYGCVWEKGNLLPLTYGEQVTFALVSLAFIVENKQKMNTHTYKKTEYLFRFLSSEEEKNKRTHENQTLERKVYCFNS